MSPSESLCALSQALSAERCRPVCLSIRRSDVPRWRAEIKTYRNADSAEQRLLELLGLDEMPDGAMPMDSDGLDDDEEKSFLYDIVTAQLHGRDRFASDMPKSSQGQSAMSSSYGQYVEWVCAQHGDFVGARVRFTRPTSQRAVQSQMEGTIEAFASLHDFVVDWGAFSANVNFSACCLLSTADSKLQLGTAPLRDRRSFDRGKRKAMVQAQAEYNAYALCVMAQHGGYVGSRVQFCSHFGFRSVSPGMEGIIESFKHPSSLEVDWGAFSSTVTVGQCTLIETADRTRCLPGVGKTALLQCTACGEGEHLRRKIFISSVNQQILTVMTDGDRLSRMQAAKALFMTREVGTIESAMDWIAQHIDDEDLDEIPEAFATSSADDQPAESEPTNLCQGSGADRGDERQQDVSFAQPSSTHVSEECNVDISRAEDKDVHVDLQEVGLSSKLASSDLQKLRAAVNRDMLTELVAMGFSDSRAVKALISTSSASTTLAIAWLAEFENHMDIDEHTSPAELCSVTSNLAIETAQIPAAAKHSDFTAHTIPRKTGVDGSEQGNLSVLDQRTFSELISMGFPQLHVEKAIHATRGDGLEPAVVWLTGHERNEEDNNSLACQAVATLSSSNDKRKVGDSNGSDGPQTAAEKLVCALQHLRNTHGQINHDGFKACMSTLRRYCKNLEERPEDPKFKRLKVEGDTFQTRVAPFDGVMEVLDILGFDNRGDVLEQRDHLPDIPLCRRAIEVIDALSPS